MYEIRTYDLRAGCVAAVEARFGEAYELNKHDWPLVAAWHTDIGPLNQIIHVFAHRDSAAPTLNGSSGDAAKAPWHMESDEFVVGTQAAFMVPLSFSPDLKPAAMGPYYEIRTYTYAPADLPHIESAWAKRIDARTKASPLCAVWRAADEHATVLVHIWPYRSLDERAAIRRRVGGWSRGALEGATGKADYAFVTQQNKIVVPASYSPLQ